MGTLLVILPIPQPIESLRAFFAGFRVTVVEWATIDGAHLPKTVCLEVA